MLRFLRIEAALPLAQGPPGAPAPVPRATYPSGFCSPSGGSADSRRSPRRCAWAWGAGRWGPGPPLRGVWHRLRLLVLPPPALQALVEVLLPPVQRSGPAVRLPTMQQGVPELELRSEPGPLQGSPSGMGHPHGFGSLLRPNCQLLPEKGRSKGRVKPQPSESSCSVSLLNTALGYKWRVGGAPEGGFIVWRGSSLCLTMTSLCLWKPDVCWPPHSGFCVHMSFIPSPPFANLDLTLRTSESL